MTYGVYGQESAGTGPVVLKVIGVTGAAFSVDLMHEILLLL